MKRGRHRGLLATFILVMPLAAPMPMGGAAASPSIRGELWAATYTGPGNGEDVAYATVVSPDGSRVFVTGGSHGSGSGTDFATIAYDSATGRPLWLRRYTNGKNSDQASAIAISPDGSRVFVTGWSIMAGMGSDYLTIAYDSGTGATLWLRRYDGPNFDDTAGSVAVSPDGSKVFVTGESDSAAGDPDYATVAYDASTGGSLWLARYNGRPGGWDGAEALGVSSDGSKVFVTGWSYGRNIYPDYATVAYDASTGSPLWVGRYADKSGLSDTPQAIAVSPDGSRVFVTGWSDGPTGRYDYATVAWDASTGAPLWVQRYDGPAHSSDYANDLTVSPDGSRVFVTGEDFETGTSYATLAYAAATGAPLWLRRFIGPQGFGSGRAIASTPDGSMVFVAGYCGTSGGADYCTLAYDAGSGTLLESRDYAGGFDDEPFDVAVSRDGARVFVTGSITRSTTGIDYGTVAFGVNG